MTNIQFQFSPKPSKAEKEAKGKSGFVSVKARWVIEICNAWVERCKSLVKNFDRTLELANTKLQLCFIRLMLIRLAVRNEISQMGFILLQEGSSEIAVINRPALLGRRKKQTVSVRQVFQIQLFQKVA